VKVSLHTKEIHEDDFETKSREHGWENTEMFYCHIWNLRKHFVHICIIVYPSPL
jgi:hypothetical protein